MAPESTAVTPYEQVNPGDLISADLFNRVQTDIRSDIATEIQKAVQAITKVENSTDSEKLDGKTLDQIEKDIIDALKGQLPTLLGDYRQIFKRLEFPGPPDYVIKHNLGLMPLVDVYQLDYFPAVSATGDTPQDRHLMWVNFYLYHDSESTIHTQVVDDNNNVQTVTVDIELRDETPFRVPFKDMLDRYKVQYDDNTTLDELVNGFWHAFFDPQGLNDRFDWDQYCHSPWFDRCCGEKRTVVELKSRRDWEHMWLKWHARKTINFPVVQTQQIPVPSPQPQPRPVPAVEGSIPGPAPTNLQVVHYDWNELGLRLLEMPVYVATRDPNASDPNTPVLDDPRRIKNPNELKVMVLLKA